MENSKNILGTESINNLLIKYSVPAIIAMLVNGLYNVVDRIFIGNIPDVGALAITGVGVTFPIMIIILAFGMLIGIGSGANISIKLGAKDTHSAEKILGNAITLSVIFGIIVTSLGLLFRDDILRLFGASDDSLYYAQSYITIILAGSFFNILAFVLSNLIRTDGNPKLSAIIMGVGCFLNIVLDAVFIFVFGMGIQGAALATVIAQVVSSVWGIYYFTSGKSNLTFKLSNLKLDKKMTGIIFSLGAAPFVMQLASSGVQGILNTSLSTYGGDLAIGAMATINSIITMIAMPIFGLSQGAQPIIGYNYGSQQYERSTRTLKICLFLTTIILSFGWALIQFFPEPIIRIFNDDPELILISIDGIRKYTLTLPLLGLTILGTNYIQAIGKAKLSMILGLLRQVILLIPLLLFLPRLFEIDGIWFAQPIADTIAFIITIAIIIKEVKSQSKLTSESE